MADANTANIATLSIAEINALYPTPNSTLTTDLSVSPYYDDYDAKKNYYRILYRPGYAVQARELTQSQTMLQKQISRFGQHMFKEGSIVLPGEFSIETDVDCIKIQDSDSLGYDIIPKNLLNTVLTNENTGVVAYVIDYADKDTLNNLPKTLYIRYTSTSPTNANVKTFSPGDTLTHSQAQITVLSENKAVTKGSRFIIREGVFFAKDHFIWFPTQSIILDRYSTDPSVRVGFQIQEIITRYTSDTSLLDPALEASNYTAPGADRLKLDPVLVVKSYENTEGPPDFVELFTIKDGIVTELYNRSQYNIIQDELAKRTLDESGDYYVRGLGVRIREHLNTGNNDGYLTGEEGGDYQALAIGVEPGLAYVKGYERQLYVTNYLKVPKAITYIHSDNQVTTTTMGNYLLCKEFVGYAVHDTGDLVYLLDVPVERISNTAAPTVGNIPAEGKTIGSARIRHIEWNSGILGDQDAVVAVYLTDIKMSGSDPFVNTKSLYSATLGADVILENGYAKLRDTSVDTLLYNTGSPYTRSVTNADGQRDFNYMFRRTKSDINFIGGLATFSPNLDANENLPYGVQDSLSSMDKKEMILTVDQDVDITVGTKVVIARVDDYTFQFSEFPGVYFNRGEKIQFTGTSANSRLYVVDSTEGTFVTVTEILPSTADLNLEEDQLGGGASITKVYTRGTVIDLNGYSSTGELRQVRSTTPKSFQIDIKEPNMNFAGTLTYPIEVSNAVEAKKILRTNCFIGISLQGSPYFDGVTANVAGPYSLGIADVTRIKSIRHRTDGVIPTGTEDGVDVTNSFDFDNGQRDSFYDLASITPKNINLTATSSLLVNFDYFEPSFTSGRGYFTIDSYPVNDDADFDPNSEIRTLDLPVYYSAASKKRYDLRNHIDFRPVKMTTATTQSIPAQAYINPSASSIFNYSGGVGTLRLPLPSSPFYYSYSYYLARKDLIVMNKDGRLLTANGIPAQDPKTPVAPPGTMPIASISITPYPSISPAYAHLINRSELSCTSQSLLNIRYTMRDIGILKDRIVNLEYYNSLNLLQKNAVDMAVIDENGLNRFKNGVFVDDFTSHQFGDVKNDDYAIVIDPEEKSIRPFFTKESIYYEFLDNESSGVQLSDDMMSITLPFTETPFIEANTVTSARNVELSSYRFIGNVYLDPDIDVWVDTQRLPDESISFGPTANNLPQPTMVWNDWQKHITGYYVEPQGPRVRPKDRDQWVYGGYFQTVPALISSPNSPRDQRVTGQVTETRTGTQTTWTYKDNNINLGERVVDVSINPYIRAQTIDINGKGFKACTRLYVFFDGERVDQYCAPMTVYEYLLTPEQRTLGYVNSNTSFITSNSANAILGNTSNLTVFSPKYGDPIVTDDTGECFLMLTLPNNGNKQFRVGQKEVVLTDSITNSVDATTSGKNYFYAQGLTEQKQKTILTTKSIVSNTQTVTETRTTSVVGYINNPSCTAYSFYVKSPVGEEGLFLTSVDVWYQRKHPNLGIWYEIREMDNAGGITRVQVPGSEIWLTANDIKASETFNEDLYTRVKFKTPIFLYSDKEYAFVMHTVGLNPEAYIWIARLGENDVRSGKRHNARPLTGTFYTTNNNMNWNIVDDIDLKIRFNRAKFQKGRGVAVIGNRGTDALVVTTNNPIDANITNALRLITVPTVDQVIAPPISIKYGETFINQQITLKANVINFKVGDKLICKKNKKVWEILSCKKSSSCESKGCDYTKIAIANNRIECEQGIYNLIYSQNNVIRNIRPSDNFELSKLKICCAKVKHCHTRRKHHCKPKLKHYKHRDECETKIVLEVTTYNKLSNGKTIYVGDVYKGEYKFKPGESVVGAISNTAAYIEGVTNFRYSTIDFEPSYLEFSNTSIGFEMKPYSNGTGNVLGTAQLYHDITPGKNYSYNSEMAVYSRTNEYQYFMGDKTNKVRITMATSSEFLSPILDISKTHSIFVDNQINANTIATPDVYASYPLECGTSGGEIANKYISTPIKLAEGQDAEDMLVMLTAYRPPTTDVIVFAKFLNVDDNETIEQKLWIPLEKKLVNHYSSLVDTNDFKEFSYTIPKQYLTGPVTDTTSGGEFQYTNSQGTQFTGYRYFQIKIALTAVNSAIVPRVADLRCMALQI